MSAISNQNSQLFKEQIRGHLANYFGEQKTCLVPKCNQYNRRTYDEDAAKDTAVILNSNPSYLQFLASLSETSPIPVLAFKFDFLAHIRSTPTDPTFPAFDDKNPCHHGLLSLSGGSPMQPDRYVADNLSDAVQEAEAANTYVVFEATTDPALLGKKLAQLERQLTYLLCRQRRKWSDSGLEVYHIVAFAGLALNRDICNQVKATLLSKQKALPLLWELFTRNRVLVLIHGSMHMYMTSITDKIAAPPFEELNNTMISLGQEVQAVQKDIKELKQMMLKVLNMTQEAMIQKQQAEIEEVRKRFRATQPDDATEAPHE